ncbi:MAG: hypothetical protein HS108_09710 [Planctomycetes bacterium]|jgi:hypothetical protein|nr:hypothetical protein [Planctomycetota bacterium]MCL4728889.1 hypothetical protein [Planctomycetota bacterium]
MKTPHAIAPLLLAALPFAAGCGQNTAEIERLNSELARQKTAQAEAQTRWENERDALRRDLNDLRSRVGEAQAGRPDRPLGESVSDLDRRMAKLEQGGGGKLDERVAALEGKIDGVRKEAVEAAKVEAAKAGTGATTGMTKAELDAYMDKKAAEAAEANKPTKNLAEVLARLSISDAEKEQLRQSVLDCKKAQLELLETPTADGRVFAEELIDTFIKIQDGKATQADVTKLFLEIVATKVPGDPQGRTYVQIIEEHKQKNRDNITKLLSPDDQKKLTAAHADWSEFEVGDGDPWGALYLERMQKYQGGK